MEWLVTRHRNIIKLKMAQKRVGNARCSELCDSSSAQCAGITAAVESAQKKCSHTELEKSMIEVRIWAKIAVEGDGVAFVGY